VAASGTRPRVRELASDVLIVLNLFELDRMAEAKALKSQTNEAVSCVVG